MLRSIVRGAGCGAVQDAFHSGSTQRVNNFRTAEIKAVAHRSFDSEKPKPSRDFNWEIRTYSKEELALIYKASTGC